MEELLPDSLKSTYQLLKRAYGNSICSQDYFVILYILYDELSDRNLAKVFSVITGKNEAIIMNDIAKSVTINNPRKIDIERVKKFLIKHGYNEWLKEE